MHSLKRKELLDQKKRTKVKIKFMEPTTIKDNFVVMEDITFGYNSVLSDGKTIFKLLFNNLNFDVKPNSRIAIVGKNGVGKSTVLKLMMEQIAPIEGTVTRNSNVKIGYYNQHFEESLPTAISGVEYLQQLNGDIKLTDSHKYLSMFGLEAIHHNTPIGSLSGGQKARVKFASFGVMKPHR